MLKRMGLRGIARELNKKGAPTTRGCNWYAETIKYILENPLYKGIAHYKENNVKNKDFNTLKAILITNCIA